MINTNIPSIEFLLTDIRFEPENTLVFNVPYQGAKIDFYFDNTRNVCFNVGKNISMEDASVYLDIHTLGRPLDHTNPIHKKDLISATKLIEESGIYKLIPFWVVSQIPYAYLYPYQKINSLPGHQVKTIMTKNRTIHKDLDTLIDHMNHLGVVMLQFHHFLICICQLQRRAANRRHATVSEM